MLSRRRRYIDVAQFFAEYEGTDQKVELVDGEACMMAGGSREHAAAARNIIRWTGNKLEGSPCEPYGSDMGLELDSTNVRFPDVAIYCDERDLGAEASGTRTFRFPKVIFEVLSPSTHAFDRGGKTAEYKLIASVQSIVLVDVGTRTLEVHDRVAGTEWRQYTVERGDPLVLRDPALTLTATEIFGS